MTSSWRTEIPLLSAHPDLAYLDTAASSLMPRQVIEAMAAYDNEIGANVSRGIHELSEQATRAYEEARQDMRDFVRAEEAVFCKNATEALNMAAAGIAIQPAHNVVITRLEHHANWLPWQRSLASLRIAGLTRDGRIDADHLVSLVDGNTRVAAFSLVSNVTGGVAPAAEICRAIRDKNPGTRIVIDAAQAVGHMTVDMGELDADFLAFSGHKMYGPTGIGVLAAKRGPLERLTPLAVGGGMVASVSEQGVEYLPVPHGLEAGTPPIAQAMGLAAATRFVQDVGLDEIRAHEQDLCEQALRTLADAGARVIGPAQADERGSLASFVLPGVHPHDVAAVADEHGVAIRAGHHCCMPLHEHLELIATSRASFAIYNDARDVERLGEALGHAMNLSLRA